MVDIEAELSSLFDAEGSQVFLHARDLAGEREIGIEPDSPVVLASVFKIPILLELAKQADEGRFDLTDRVRVGSPDRVLGGTGLSTMLDDVELSVRDLAQLMMSVSDNTATDVLLDKVGLESVNETLRALGLANTELVGSCREVLQQLIDDVVGPDVDVAPEELLERFQKAAPERAPLARSLQPELTSRSTARETTELLSLIWEDRVSSPNACAEVRRILDLQVWPHRFRAGFPSSVKVASKRERSCRYATRPAL
ncbi:MAG: class A beta-lactamase-related serine hydrolase [Actinobacteria bacterium]|nr:class A beta-lactamase-related serine hydrolase [Actinomycetota bacterium]